MVSKSELTYYSSLLIKKYRQREKKFIIEGEKIFFEALEASLKCELVFISNEFFEGNQHVVSGIKEREIRLEQTNERVIKKISDTKSPPGLVAVFMQPDIPDEKMLRDSGVPIVALENINDPGNFGTILRTCDWLGYTNVIVSASSVELYNPKVIRASMGSLFHVNVFMERDFFEYLSMLKESGYEVVTADMDGEAVNLMDRKSKRVLVFCNEANGPSDDLLEKTDKKITIPPSGKAESLNVAIASSIILYSMRER